ncbi:hypothetical protein C2E21_6700 [Chlorella sorokiniana]|uniref:Uncharacterized protein n=1 Tax=Chlorella sorokiniana TaxID=3076 RepID=A0A2P6TJK3_CHLSO|nr:hypothetical protein C2E21_6700 [Chlorella sorokiniana]|eukprot:PRW44243.1 hypothetical protein C2E21_6700 [Chlorella sorokiniana]
MLSLQASVLSKAGAATAQPQRRTTCLAPCLPAAQPAALSRAGLSSAPTAPSRHRGRVLLRASAGGGGGGGSDLESEALEQQSFSSLAKAVANKLASEVAGQEGTYNRLKLWLDQAAAPAKRVVEEGAKGNLGEAKEGAKQAKGVLGKAASLAASALGVGGFMKGAGSEESPAAAAARALGADSINITVDAVKNWLTSPHRKGDVQMVGALVYKMLSFLEHETGEKFEGKDHQYKWLSRLAMEVFGGSMTSRVVRALVDAYLRAPSRGL